MTEESSEPMSAVFENVDKLTAWLRKEGFKKLDTVSVSPDAGLALLLSPAQTVEQWRIERVPTGIQILKLPDFEVEYER